MQHYLLFKIQFVNIILLKNGKFTVCNVICTMYTIIVYVSRKFRIMERIDDMK